MRPSSQQKALTPQTKRVVLRSEGFQKPTFTVHHYLETREVEIPGANGGRGLEHIFTCFKSGAQRRYGFDRLPGQPDEAALETPIEETN